MAFALGPITIEVDDDGRFRLTVAFDETDSPIEHAHAQLALHYAAEEICDRYDAVARQEGGILVNDAEPFRGDRPAISITMEYVCVLNPED